MKMRSLYQGGLKKSRAGILDPVNCDPAGELLLLWPTPIYIFRNDPQHCSWHVDLVQEIVQRIEDEKGFRANWKKSDFFKWRTPKVEEFMAFLRQHIDKRIEFDVKPRAVDTFEWGWKAWVNVLPQGGWHQPHIHEKSTLSFIYYLEVPSTVTPASILADLERGEVSGGVLQFQDPRGSSPYMSCEGIDTVASAAVRLLPSDGVLCIFPSFLSHFVAPNTSDNRRISIAGNVFGIKPRRVFR